MFKSGPFYLARAGTAKVFIDHFDLMETKLACVIGQSILPTLTLLVVNHLPR
jgi:hypothetical protein